MILSNRLFTNIQDVTVLFLYVNKRKTICLNYANFITNTCSTLGLEHFIKRLFINDLFTFYDSRNIRSQLTNYTAGDKQIVVTAFTIYKQI